MDRVERFSHDLQIIAKALDHALHERAGERVGWLLVMNIDDVSQYVANLPREAGIDMLEDLLKRFKANQPDIPAHLNPSVKKQ